MPINWRFFVPKFADIEPGLLELFENVTGVRFFLDTVYVTDAATVFCIYILVQVAGLSEHLMPYLASVMMS